MSGKKQKRTSHIEYLARGLVIKRDAVLLCRNDRGGYLYLPGGHIEFSEPAESALRREFKEETGIEVQVGEALACFEAVFDQGGVTHHELNIVFHVALPLSTSGQAKPIRSRESGISFHWIDRAAIVEIDLRPSQIKAWLCAAGDSTPEGPWWLGSITQ